MKPLKCSVLPVPPHLTPQDTAPCQEPHCRQDPASSWQLPASSSCGFSISASPQPDAEQHAWRGQQESFTLDTEPEYICWTQFWDFWKVKSWHKTGVCRQSFLPKGSLVHMPLIPENAPRASDFLPLQPFSGCRMARNIWEMCCDPLRGVFFQLFPAVHCCYSQSEPSGICKKLWK